MSRSGRLFELAHLLARRRPVTLDEIARRFEVSPRTAYRDLAELSFRKIPVARSEHGYRLLETATLRPLNLTAEEHALLQVALGNPVLRRQGALQKTFAALEAKLDAVTSHLEETPEALRLAGLDRSGPDAGKVLPALEEAVRGRREVEIHYLSLSGGSRRWRGVHPWRLFHRSDAWYLAGHCLINREPRIFRLDRIAGVRETGARFDPPADFDLDQFLADSWAVFRGGDAYDVVLRFDHSLAPLILHAQHHPGEKKRQLANGSVDYRVKLSSLEEIARWIVGFGGGVRVVGPEGLRERVKRIGEGAVAAALGSGEKTTRRRRKGGR